MSKGDMDSDIPKTTSAEKMCAACGRIRNQRQTLPENSLFLSDEKTETNRTDRKICAVKNRILPYEFIYIISGI